MRSLHEEAPFRHSFRQREKERKFTIRKTTMRLPPLLLAYCSSGHTTHKNVVAQHIQNPTEGPRARPCARRTRWTCSDLLGPIVSELRSEAQHCCCCQHPTTTHMCARAHTHTMAPSTIVYSCFDLRLPHRMPSRCRSHLWSLTLCARGDLQPVCVRQPVSTSRLIGMLSPAARTSGRIVGPCAPLHLHLSPPPTLYARLVRGASNPAQTLPTLVATTGIALTIGTALGWPAGCAAG